MNTSNDLNNNKKYKILFVCHGNICRSPMGEFIMKHLVEKAGKSEEYLIDSSAVSYEEDGCGIYPPAARKLSEHRIPFGSHAAHRISAAEAAELDLILIMDSSNERLFSRIIRPEDMQKVHYLMEYAGKPFQSVSDPWYTGDFGTAYRDIYSACVGLLETLEGR